MKTLFKIGAVLFIIYIHPLFFVQSLSAQQQQDYISFQVFYDELSPYGLWVDYPNYDYVWIPNVDAYFAPYSTAGQWVLTGYGWTWVSAYSWGWAPFHYGRWDYDDYYGWFWVPDSEWGPSWVVWRKAHGYYGWAPMSPGMNIAMNFNSRYEDLKHWNFVQYSDFGKSNIDNYYVNTFTHRKIIRNSSVINNKNNDNRRNTTYIFGPPLQQAQRITGRTFRSVEIRDYNKPGQVLDNNRLELYRPLVESNRVINQRCAPSEITDFRDVKSPKERVESFRENTIFPKDNIQDNTQVLPGRSRRIYRQYRLQLPRQQSIQNIQVQERGLTQKEEQLHQPMNRQNK